MEHWVRVPLFGELWGTCPYAAHTASCACCACLDTLLIECPPDILSDAAALSGSSPFVYMHANKKSPSVKNSFYLARHEGLEPPTFANPGAVKCEVLKFQCFRALYAVCIGIAMYWWFSLLAVTCGIFCRYQSHICNFSDKKVINFTGWKRLFSPLHQACGERLHAHNTSWLRWCCCVPWA